MPTSYTKDRSVTLLMRTVSDVKNLGGFSGISQQSVIRTLKRDRTGYPNPNYRDQIAKGQNACTNMTGTYTTLVSEQGNALVIHTDPNVLGGKELYSDQYKGDFAFMCEAPRIDWNPSLTSNVSNNRALIDYLKTARHAVVQFSAPTFIGELGQTIHMIKHPAEGLRNIAKGYLNRVKHAKTSNPKNWKKNLGSLWLESAFGWQPLISDISKAYALHKSHVREKFVPISGFGKDEWFDKARSTPIGSLNVGGKGLGYTFSTRVTESSIVKYKGLMIRRVNTTASIYDKLEPWGFDPLEFVPTIWELLPWSFLIDYFSNIGDVITANCAIVSDIAWTNRTVVGFQTSETSSSYDKSLTNTLHSQTVHHGSGSSSTCKMTLRKISRIANYPVGRPSIMLEVPTFIGQFENMLALFAQSSKEIHPQSFGRRK